MANETMVRKNLENIRIEPATDSNNNIPEFLTLSLSEKTTFVNEVEQNSMLDLNTDSEIERVFGTDGFDPLLVTRPPKPWNKWTLKGDFEIGKLIGSGKYGRVYLVRTKKERRTVALKIIHEKDVVNEGMESLINRETEIHGSLKHNNIIRMFGFFHDDENLVFVIEYAPGGDVFSNLNSQLLGRYTEEKAATYIDQISDALEYLHSNGIIHRDIKPENLLIGCFGEIKVADFGLSIRKNTSDGISSTTVCGTLEYMAPEIITGAEYDEGVDIWCVGVLIYEFLTGGSPFDTKCRDQHTIIMNIHDIKFSCPSYMSFPAKDLINKILCKTSDERIPLNKIRSHDWILKNKTMEQKKLLPCFDKFQYLEAPLIDKYKAARHSLNTKRTIDQIEYENPFKSLVRSFST